MDTYWGPHRRDILTRIGSSETDIDTCWPMHHVTHIGNDVTLQQNDGFSCGPIACMVIWYLFCPQTGIEKWRLLSVPQFRRTVVNMMTTMLKTAYVDLLNVPQHSQHKERNENSSQLHCAEESTIQSQRGTATKRKQHDDLRNETSRKQRDKMIRNREASVPIVKKGDIVLLSPDKRDREQLHRGSDVAAIVLKVFENTKSILAITACGIVAKTSKFQSQAMSIPIDKYRSVQEHDPILSDELNQVRSEVLSGLLHKRSTTLNRVAFTSLHKQVYDKKQSSPFLPMKTRQHLSSKTMGAVSPPRGPLRILTYPNCYGYDLRTARFSHPFCITRTRHITNPIEIHLFTTTETTLQERYILHLYKILFADYYNVDQMGAITGGRKCYELAHLKMNHLYHVCLCWLTIYNNRYTIPRYCGSIGDET